MISPFDLVSLIIQMLLMLLGAAFIGYYIGRSCSWCAPRKREEYLPETRYTPAVLQSHTTAPVVAPVAIPARHTASGKDDLKIVEGIGPAIERLLHAEGIHTFEQLASTPASRVQDILTKAGPIFASHNPASWAEQARLARDGKWTELEILKNRLIGGNHV
jgi:predicted flap endonuclease-1-like 5' DNA nuclease